MPAMVRVHRVMERMRECGSDNVEELLSTSESVVNGEELMLANWQTLTDLC